MYAIAHSHDPHYSISLISFNFELEMLSIVNFYMTNILCYVFPGADRDFMNGSFFVHQLSPADFLQFNPRFEIPQLNLHIPLSPKNHDFQGGGLNFFKYNCSTEDLSPGTVLMFPSDVTHFYTNNKIGNGVFTFLSFKMHYTSWMCYQKCSETVCPGFNNVVST